jgi:hypothetical protein
VSRTSTAARLASRGILRCLCGALLCVPGLVRAQGAPPFISNDPGTPGNGNWEINLGTTQTVMRGGAAYELPQIDVNFGLGDRIQLTYEIPYVLATASGEPTQSGWGNASPGIKWRFLDQGDDGWQIATFPQLESGLTSLAQRQGLGEAGPRLLLPIEIEHPVGPVDVDFEGGYYLPWHGPRERILGLVVGHAFTKRLDLGVEIYDDRAVDALPHSTTLDVGGHFKLRRGIIALFMAGRGLNGDASERPQFIGYFGIQILLSHYGRELSSE